MMECIVTIKSFVGTTEDRSLSALYEDVRCLISPASTQVSAFYEGVPVGQLHQYEIKDQSVDGVPDAAEITITDPQQSGFVAGDVFIAISKSQKQRTGGRFILTGACYIKE